MISAPRLLGLFTLALAGCNSIGRIQVPMPGSGAVVAPPHVYDLVRELEPRVIAMLGSRRAPGTYSFHVWERDHRQPAGTFLRWNCAQVMFSPSSLYLDDLDRLVAHELVHVHADARVTELPAAAEEGIANWIAELVTGRARAYDGPAPDPTALRRALTLTNDQYLALPDSELAQVDQAGAWLASRLLPVSDAILSACLTTPE